LRGTELVHVFFRGHRNRIDIRQPPGGSISAVCCFYQTRFDAGEQRLIGSSVRALPLSEPRSPGASSAKATACRLLHSERGLRPVMELIGRRAELSSPLAQVAVSRACTHRAFARRRRYAAGLQLGPLRLLGFPSAHQLARRSSRLAALQDLAGRRSGVIERRR
jgi:hypothetical protein